MQVIDLREGANGRNRRRFALFEYGFRPFFLLAGLDAATMIPIWVLALRGRTVIPANIPPLLWHGHEMLFGFVAAAIAGFLLTTVPSWTGRQRLNGTPLMALVLLWLAGRAAFLAPTAWWRFLAPLDLAFLPVLCLVLAVPLVRTRNWRNLPFVVLLTLFTLTNLAIHLEIDGIADFGRQGLILAIDVVAMLIVVVGGRIIPAFTRNALHLRGIQGAIAPHPLVDTIAIAMTALIIPADLLSERAPWLGAIALGAAAANAIRLGQWRSWLTLHSPILWVIHLGYAWVVAGLALKGVAAVSDALPLTAALHAFTIGGAGTMILAVMSRASLGHTGRNLVATKPVVLAYLLVSVAAIARLLAAFPSLVPTAPALDFAGTAWMLAFALFVLVYAPILWRPRVDGRPG